MPIQLRDVNGNLIAMTAAQKLQLLTEIGGVDQAKLDAKGLAVTQPGGASVASAVSLLLGSGLVLDPLAGNGARIRRSNAWRDITYFGAASAQVSETGQPSITFSGYISGSTLTVTAVTKGTLFVGAYIEAPGLYGAVKISALGTGTGNTGTYTVTTNQTLGSAGAVVAFVSCSQPGNTFATDVNASSAIKALRRCGRFRLRFSTGDRSDALTGFILSGHVEVPGKNGGPTAFIPVRFGGSATFFAPAGGGYDIVTDWIGWPVEAGDILHAKMYLHNGGAAFTISTQSPLTNPARNASTKSQITISGRGSDATAIPYGTSPWIENTGYVNGACFAPVAWEAESNELDRPITADFWGDSIGYGAGSSAAIPFLEQICVAAGVPFNNLCISGSNQTQIPRYALRRLQYARGDIAIVEHGRNSGDTAGLAKLWSFLRSLGYRKIIQTTTTNYTLTGNNALQGGGDSSAMRAFQRANVGVGDGPDVLWDVQGALQDQTTGLWLPGVAPADGLHPGDAGNTAVAVYAAANGWHNDLKA